MANIGHPVLGDKTYGIEIDNVWASKHLGLSRQFLHAWRLHFEMNEKIYAFEAPLKPDLEKAMKILKN
jgi:23S rRNA-/tRNA-specific pseudouridylate synthase